jgi:hypothetical protein
VRRARARAVERLATSFPAVDDAALGLPDPDAAKTMAQRLARTCWAAYQPPVLVPSR